ncbi:MAG: YceI family protein [Alphaproteobacteria bacterium]
MGVRYRRRAAAAAFAVAGMFPAAASAEPDRYTIDPAHFSIGFSTHHLGYAEVIGMFLEASGSFEYDAEAPAVREIEVVVLAASVFTNHQARDGHLRGTDFLDAAAFPEIRFVGTEAEQTGENTGIVRGELSLLGETHPAEFEVVLNKAADYPFGAGPPYVVGVSARGTITRSLYGMTYGVANGWVGDEIALVVEFEAIRQD